MMRKLHGDGCNLLDFDFATASLIGSPLKLLFRLEAELFLYCELSRHYQSTFYIYRYTFITLGFHLLGILVADECSTLYDG